MSSPIPSNGKKWIALSALILFILGGGVYQMRKRSAAPVQSASNPDVQSNLVSSGSNDKAAPEAVAPTANSAALTADSKKQAGTTSGVAIPGGPALPSLAIPGAALSGAAPSSTPGAAPAVPAPPQDTCYTVTYKHKTVASHPDEETCSHHKNWLKLKHKDINSKSVCVRVNGTPVHYLSVKGHGDELIFGSIAGPKSKVTVRYCTGKLTGCSATAGAVALKDDCTVPKDEFMEAIGGSEGKGGDSRLGQWDPSNPSEKEADVMAQLDGAVKHELETNSELNGRAPEGKMFKDWLAENDAPINACGTQQASN